MFFITKYLLALITLCSLMQINPVSIVYNMRVSQITLRERLDTSPTMPNIVGATTLGQWRELKSGSKQLLYGELGTYLHSRKSTYLKIDGAVGRVNNCIEGQTFQRTQTDDLLFTGGYGHMIGKHGRVSYSGLFGIPTHRDTSLDFAEFGTGHVGLGGQIDGSYAYVKNRSRVLLAAVRLVHFFPRNITSHDPRLAALYPNCIYDFKPGNSIDVYVAHQLNWQKINRITCGYDASFIGVGASLNPNIPSLGATSIIIRHSFFAAYSRITPMKKIETGFIVGLSGGFDSQPAVYGSRYLVTSWVAFGLFF